jgi:tetrahydromethanopterin S-methyltransferase subunit B
MKAFLKGLQPPLNKGRGCQIIMDEFSPREYFEKAFAYWWLVVVFAMLGALAGWLVHLRQPPLYDAQARITLSFDYGKTGVVPEYDQDKAYAAVGALVDSTAIKDAALKQMQDQGIQVDANTFYQNASVERLGSYWELRVRYPDPQTTAAIANTWLDVSYKQIEVALEHAIQVDNLETYLNDLETCVQRSVAVSPSYAGCSTGDVKTIQAQMQTIGAQIYQEKLASQGLISALGVASTQRATVPTRPSVLGLNLLILSGALIGFLMGVWVAGFLLPGRAARMLQRG